MSLHCLQNYLNNKRPLRKLKKVEVYRVVNNYFSGERAKLINKWLIKRLKEEGLLIDG